VLGVVALERVARWLRGAARNERLHQVRLRIRVRKLVTVSSQLGDYPASTLTMINLAV
jgi:hypothetical protein